MSAKYWVMKINQSKLPQTDCRRGCFWSRLYQSGDATLSLQVERRLPINWKSFCKQKRKPVILTVHPTIRPNRIFSRNSDSGTPACLAGCVMDILHAPYERRRQWWPGGVFNVGKSKAQLFEKAEQSRLHLKM